jgi:hypothetical protein
MTKVRLLTPVLLPLLVGLGCSSGNPNAPSTVSGTVNYNGQSIKGGLVRFHAPDGTAYESPIAPDGVYTAADLPTGEMTVTVDTETINPNPGTKSSSKTAGKKKMEEARKKMTGGREAPPGYPPGPGDRYVDIPDKYADPKTSPLKTTLKKGSQKYDITLTD